MRGRKGGGEGEGERRTEIQTRGGTWRSRVWRGQQDPEACPGQRAVPRCRPSIALLCDLGRLTQVPGLRSCLSAMETPVLLMLGDTHWPWLGAH